MPYLYQRQGICIIILSVIGPPKPESEVRYHTVFNGNARNARTGSKDANSDAIILCSAARITASGQRMAIKIKQDRSSKVWGNVYSRSCTAIVQICRYRIIAGSRYVER